MSLRFSRRDSRWKKGNAVKISMKHVLMAGVALAMAAPASAAPIIGLKNTGLGTPRAADPNWTLTGGTAFRGRPINVAWIPNDSTSAWLTPAAIGTTSFDRTSVGNYAYNLIFSLAGFQAATASFAGRFAVDNRVTSITLNGVTINGSGGTLNSWTNFSSLTNAFRPGNNTLTFNVLNSALPTGNNPTGLRVEFLSSSVTVVPEAATWAMMIGGFGLIGFAMRRRSALSVRYA